MTIWYDNDIFHSSSMENSLDGSCIHLHTREQLTRSANNKRIANNNLKVCLPHQLQLSDTFVACPFSRRLENTSAVQSNGLTTTIDPSSCHSSGSYTRIKACCVQRLLWPKRFSYLFSYSYKQYALSDPKWILQWSWRENVSERDIIIAKLVMSFTDHASVK